MTKIVLIGGPSSGKSTLIKMLGEKGFPIIPEAAKDLILARGGISPNNREDYIKFQLEVVEKQVRNENQFYRGETTFLDRGIYDNLVYCNKYLGFVPTEVEKLISEHHRYDRVFLLDRLPFVKENFRIENDEAEAKELHERVVSTYENFGYNLERIPVLPREERLNYLFGRVK